MAKIIDLPKLSPTMEEGTLVRWAKNEGDVIAVDDLLAEVETDKATMEFRSFDKGTLLKKLVAEGQTAKLGQPVAIFGTAGEDISALLAGLSGGAPVASVAKSEPAQTVAAKPAEPSVALAAAVTAPSVVASSGPASHTIASTAGLAGLVLLPPKAAPHPQGAPGGPSSPRVRKLAREHGLDVETIVGTGENGRITAADIERAASAGAPSRAPAAQASASVGDRREDEVKPASQMRKAIARRLVESKQTVPHFYLEAELDVEALLLLREQMNDGVDKAAKVSVNDLFIKACALALNAVPASNASWVDGNIVQHRRVDISVAVAVEDGLVTPVLRDADRKTVSTISSEVRELATRARAKKLKPEEMQGGVFSISNLGMFGIDRFSAVINPPEGMILAIGQARDVAVVKNGALAPGKRCSVTLSCDHRVVDGALGAQFLQALRALVEHPVKILL
ncbi:MAG: dihydrolipoamide acetyltransferase family protein [Polyangiales bacterium]